MKPRTKIQQEVYNLSKTVIPMDDKIRNWALKECNENFAFATKHKFWCTNCGCEHPTKLVKKDYVRCPECRVVLKVKPSRVRKFFQQYYVGFAEVLKDYQVIRLFVIYSNHRIGENAKVSVTECVMRFLPDLWSVEPILVARATNMGGYEPLYGSLEIRKPTVYKQHCYNPYPEKYHPSSKFKDEYVKYGINHELQGLTFDAAWSKVRFCSKSETLLKAKQYSLFESCYDRPYKIDEYWSSIKIALRNKYKIDNARIWLDHLDLLRDSGKDIRSPKYICSLTLMADHERMIARRREEQERRREEQRIISDEKARERELKELESFEKRKQLFSGLVFKNGDLEIKTLDSIEEFKIEGDTHHHCVYVNKYYLKENSLVLSAQVDGKRVETVEISLKQMKVVQSRGLQNQASEYNKEIVELVNGNMYQIIDRYQKLGIIA